MKIGMKIGIPRTGNDLGGVTTHVETLTRSLGYTVDFEYWFPKPTPAFTKLLFLVGSGFSNSKARIKHLNYRTSIVARWLEANCKEFDLIHTHDVIAGLAVKRLSFHKPHIHTIHGPLSREVEMDTGLREYSRYVRQIESIVYKGADHLIAVDTGQKDIAIQDFGVDPAKISVIANAVDVDDVVSTARGNFDHPILAKLKHRRQLGKRVIVLPRRLVQKNGPLVAVESLLFLPASWELWVLGDGPLRNEILTLSSKYHLDERVHLLGPQPRGVVLAAMDMADIVTIPSVPSHGVVEATSLAALEAMALGKVVVASRIGGLSEIISHGVTGVLFNAGEPNKLAESVLNIIDDPIGMSTIAMNARRYVEHEWGVDKWSQKVLAIYLQVMGAMNG